MSEIPTIETARLSLRGPEPQDYPDFKATFTSYRARFMGGPLNAYESWMLYAAEIGHWDIRGFGMWMVHDRVTDETYGMVGGWQPAKWPEREIAWVIWPDKAGRGYALEAAHAARGVARRVVFRVDERRQARRLDGGHVQRQRRRRPATGASHARTGEFRGGEAA